MNVERVSHAVGFLPQTRPDYIWPQHNLKRKLSSFLPPIGKTEWDYPSPPMSSPPSPSRPAPELSRGAVTGSGSVLPANAMTAAVPAPYLPPPGHSILSSLPPPPPPTTFYHPPFLASSNTALYPPLGSTQSAQRLVTDSPALATGSTIPGISSTRPGRKSKAHVASACINCKRAHLSCDVERPCTRCVASGKQDTCFDVQHKKRGRPRLREEEPKVEQPAPAQSVSTTALAAGGSSNPRPIAGTRHRRTDSLRSLRSQTSDSVSARSILAPAPAFASAPSQSQFSYQQPPPPSPAPSTPEVPTAYLDLDLVFLRANRAYQQIMASGQEIRGRYLGEIAAPADNESFQNIRARLRTEREGREPAYMPPIVHAGQDQLHGVTDQDVDRLTQSFADQTYRWRRNTPAASPETFPARVRLAKAESYFVVVTLPSFRPVSPRPPMPLPGVAYAPPSMIERNSPQMPVATQSAPPPGYYPYPVSARPSPQKQVPVESRQYLPPHLGPQYHAPQSYQAFQGPLTPQFHTAESRTTPAAFGSRSLGSELSQPPATSLQLPPLGLGPLPPSPLAAPEYAGASGSQTWTEDEDRDEEDQSPRKRRRMGIDDVLQR